MLCREEEGPTFWREAKGEDRLCGEAGQDELRRGGGVAILAGAAALGWLEAESGGGRPWATCGPRKPPRAAESHWTKCRQAYILDGAKRPGAPDPHGSSGSRRPDSIGEMMNEARDTDIEAQVGEDRRLPDAELEVMACIWQRGQATAREIREAMAGFRPMTHGAAVTLLKRLEAKGWVTREKGPVGKAFVYRAVRRPGPTRRRVVRDILCRVFGGNGVAMVSALFDDAPPTTQQLDELQQLFEDLRRKAEPTKDQG